MLIFKKVVLKSISLTFNLKKLKKEEQAKHKEANDKDQIGNKKRTEKQQIK